VKENTTKKKQFFVRTQHFDRSCACKPSVQ